MRDGGVRCKIIALRNEKGSYNLQHILSKMSYIIALRNEKGSYNQAILWQALKVIIALRNEKGSYPFLRKN